MLFFLILRTVFVLPCVFLFLLISYSHLKHLELVNEFIKFLFNLDVNLSRCNLCYFLIEIMQVLRVTILMCFKRCL